MQAGRLIHLHEGGVGMKCPHCGHEKSRVTETRAGDEADRRIRLCQGCGKTFQTLERVCVFAGRAAGYIESGQAPALVAVPDPTPKTSGIKRYVASTDEDCLINVCAEAQPLLVEWWNTSRKSKHGTKATWTEGAWLSSVARVAKLPAWQQVLLARAGVEHGWQALKPEYMKDELAAPTAQGRPMPKDPAMLAALEQWPSQTA
ncbi:MAG: uncultured phage MedDCM-OCT-S38-C3 [Cyanobacteriota bacterium]